MAQVALLLALLVAVATAGYDSAHTPLYADPVFDAAHDAEFVWHEGEQCWWSVPTHSCPNRSELNSWPRSG